MSKRDLSKMSINQLLQYKQELMKVFDRLSYECENWSKAHTAVVEQLENRRIGLDILEKKLIKERETSGDHEFEFKNNLH